MLLTNGHVLYLKIYLPVLVYVRSFARCLKQFVSTDSSSSHEFASQFGLAFVLYVKSTQKVSRRLSQGSVE